MAASIADAESRPSVASMAPGSTVVSGRHRLTPSIVESSTPRS